jgi:hypothetical protein
MLDGLSRDGAEHPVDKPRCSGEAMRLRVVHALVYGRVAWNTKKKQLVDAKA